MIANAAVLVRYYFIPIHVLMSVVARHAFRFAHKMFGSSTTAPSTWKSFSRLLWISSTTQKMHGARIPSTGGRCTFFSRSQFRRLILSLRTVWGCLSRNTDRTDARASEQPSAADILAQQRAARRARARNSDGNGPPPHDGPGQSEDQLSEVPQPVSHIFNTLLA